MKKEVYKGTYITISEEDHHPHKPNILAHWLIEVKETIFAGRTFQATAEILEELDKEFNGLIVGNVADQILEYLSFERHNGCTMLLGRTAYVYQNPFVPITDAVSLVAALARIGDSMQSVSTPSLGTHAPSANPWWLSTPFPITMTPTLPTPPSPSYPWLGNPAPTPPMPAPCKCSMANLLSVGHDPSCPEKK